MSIGPSNLPGLPALPGLPGGSNSPLPQGLQPPGLDNDAGLPPLPPGIVNRVLERGFDSLPPGLARQLGDAGLQAPAVPTTPASPGPGPATPFGAQGPAPATPGTLPASTLPTPAASAPSLPANPMAALLASAVGQVVASVAGALRGEVIANPALPASPANAAPNAVPGLPNSVPAAAPNALPAAAPSGAAPATPAANPMAAARADGLPSGPVRSDAVPAQRSDPGLLERMAAMLRPGGTTQATQTPSTLPAANTAQTAALMTVPLLLVPPSQSPADARGITLLAVNDRAGVQRPDVMLAGMYTADGPQRRRVRRGTNVLPARLSRWLIALGGGARATGAQADPEAALSAAMQWLFWLLAVIAYACLGLALIALLPAGSDVLGGSGRSWTGGFALAGLVAAAGAWWFARHLSARGTDDSAMPEIGRGEVNMPAKSQALDERRS